jgi:hypothetical protein
LQVSEALLFPARGKEKTTGVEYGSTNSSLSGLSRRSYDLSLPDCANIEKV